MSFCPAAVELLEKFPESREPEDLNVIMKQMRSITSFKKYSSKMQEKLCKIARYMK